SLASLLSSCPTFHTTLPRPPPSTLFPYTTLFRSRGRRDRPGRALERRGDPLGRPGGAGRPRVRLREPVRGRPGTAVRVQLRPGRPVPDGRPGRAFPAHREPRVLDRADDVPRLRRGEPDPRAGRDRLGCARS